MDFLVFKADFLVFKVNFFDSARVFGGLELALPNYPGHNEDTGAGRDIGAARFLELGSKARARISLWLVFDDFKGFLENVEVRILDVFKKSRYNRSPGHHNMIVEPARCLSAIQATGPPPQPQEGVSVAPFRCVCGFDVFKGLKASK